MTPNMLQAFVCAELGELWDAESQVSQHLPHMVQRVRDGRTRRLVRSRVDQSQLHAERFDELLKFYGHSANSRSCARVRQSLSEYERRIADPLLDPDEVVVSQLMRIDDYSIAACTFAVRCAEAVADVAGAMTLTGIIAEKHAAKEALSECSRMLVRTHGSLAATASTCASNRHRTWRAADELESHEQRYSVVNSPRHSPAYVPRLRD